MGDDNRASDRVLTLPNLLSLLRLLGVPVFFWLVVSAHADLWAVLLLGVAGVTDWLDGFLARRWHQITKLGQALDPLADRLYILAMVVAMAIRGIVPWRLVIALGARDAMLVGLVPVLRRRGRLRLPVTFVGKTATFCLFYAFPLILVGTLPLGGWERLAFLLGWACALAGSVLYWVAGLGYVGQTIRLLRQTPT